MKRIILLFSFFSVVLTIIVSNGYDGYEHFRKLENYKTYEISSLDTIKNQEYYTISYYNNNLELFGNNCTESCEEVIDVSKIVEKTTSTRVYSKDSLATNQIEKFSFFSFQLENISPPLIMSLVTLIIIFYYFTYAVLIKKRKKIALQLIEGHTKLELLFYNKKYITILITSNYLFWIIRYYLKYHTPLPLFDTLIFILYTASALGFSFFLMKYFFKNKTSAIKGQLNTILFYTITISVKTFVVIIIMNFSLLFVGANIELNNITNKYNVTNNINNGYTLNYGNVDFQNEEILEYIKSDTAKIYGELADVASIFEVDFQTHLENPITDSIETCEDSCVFFISEDYFNLMKLKDTNGNPITSEDLVYNNEGYSYVLANDLEIEELNSYSKFYDGENLLRIPEDQKLRYYKFTDVTQTDMTFERPSIIVMNDHSPSHMFGDTHVVGNKEEIKKIIDKTDYIYMSSFRKDADNLYNLRKSQIKTGLVNSIIILIILMYISIKITTYEYLINIKKHEILTIEGISFIKKFKFFWITYIIIFLILLAIPDRILIFDFVGVIIFILLFIIDLIINIFYDKKTKKEKLKGLYDRNK